MEGMRLRLGYRKLRLGGHEYRGHEFHYSSIVPQEVGEETVGEQLTARDEVAPTLLYRRGNVLAGYTHLYSLSKIPSRSSLKLSIPLRLPFARFSMGRWCEPILVGG